MPVCPYPTVPLARDGSSLRDSASFDLHSDNSEYEQWILGLIAQWSRVPDQFWRYGAVLYTAHSSR